MRGNLKFSQGREPTPVAGLVTESRSSYCGKARIDRRARRELARADGSEAAFSALTGSPRKCSRTALRWYSEAEADLVHCNRFAVTGASEPERINYAAA
jgi:hypothetical protein